MRLRSGLLALVLALGASGAALAGDGPSGPSTSKECAVCHVRWVPTYFSGGGGDYAARPDTDAVADEVMCFSCHDGSVRDSRVRILQGESHQVGEPPPPGFVLPEGFPLDADGNITCATCHTAHGVSKEQAAQGDTFFLRFSNRGAAMCAQCHSGHVGGPEQGNHPLQKAAATDGAETSSVDCQSCHTAHGGPASPLLQRTASDARLCMGCHEDRGNSGALGHAGGGHPVGVRPQTASVSTALLERGARTGPQGEVICLSCHKVHDGARYGSQLLVGDPQGGALCLQCHQDREALVGSSHDLGTSRPEARNAAGRTVGEAGTCSACHQAHGSARRVEAGVPRGTSLCLSCHGDDGLARIERLQGYTHPVGALRDDGQPVTCSSCHDPHRPVPEADDSDTPAVYLRQAREQVCLSCHEDQAQVTQTRHQLEGRSLRTRNANGLTALQSGPCLTCHEVHSPLADQRFSRLLAESGSDPIGRLCNSCHATGQLPERSTLSGHDHPTGVAPAAVGIDTDLPLAAQPGRRARDAVMTCATCHDPHVWSPVGIPDPPEARVDGDATTSFLRVDNSGGSALCTSCHVEARSIALSDHDLVRTAPDAENALGQSVADAGTCSACHIPHRSQREADLWARETERTGAGRAKVDELSSYCLSCHDDGGPAGNKVPEALHHPPVDIVDLRRGSSGQDFPVFDPDTGRRARAGRMDCPSCHQPHRWSAAAGDTGALQAQTEGDATTSFLRTTSDRLPCRDCHGTDSIFLYLGFHDPSARSGKVQLVRP